MTPNHESNAPTNEVASAADDPMPVFTTSVFPLASDSKYTVREDKNELSYGHAHLIREKLVASYTVILKTIER